MKYIVLVISGSCFDNGVFVFLITQCLGPCCVSYFYAVVKGGSFVLNFNSTRVEVFQVQT